MTKEVESELVERLQQLLDEATWDSIEHDGDDDRKEANSVLAMIAASLSQLQQRIAEVEREADELEDQLHQWEREANSQKARAEAAEAALQGEQT